ncbi:MAG TPA: SPASM domain-containing protein, partial [Polyangiaceae bacterium]
EAARQGLLRMAAAGAKVVPLAVVNPDTASELGASAAELFSLPVARAHVTCNLRTVWDDAALRGLREGLRAAAEIWARAFRAGRSIWFEPFTTKILSHLHAAMPCASRCQFGARELVVAPSGRFYPCGELVGDDSDARHVIGNLDDGVWSDQLQAMRADKERIELTCQDCGIRERCSSSCGCKHVALTGQFGVITDTLCELESAFIEAADTIAAELYAEGCAAFIDYFYRQPWRANSVAKLVQLCRAASGTDRAGSD